MQKAIASGKINISKMNTQKVKKKSKKKVKWREVL
jgi:hypothetical protein